MAEINNSNSKENSDLKQELDQLTNILKFNKKLEDSIPNTLKLMIQSISDINSALTHLKHTANISDSELSLYFSHAAESAQKYGSSIEDLLQVTAELNRQGFNLPDTRQLTDAIALYQNISDNLSKNEASQSLITALAAFELEAGEAESAVDKFNELSNNYSINASGINEALSRSAASFHEANTDLSKSLSLIAGTNEIVQDPSAVGDMWNTVTERVQSTKQELDAAGKSTEGMLDTTAELRDMVQGLTGFNIMSDSAGTQLKDMYEIVVGIGDKWAELSATDQSRLLNAFAGGPQNDILSAAFNNAEKIKEIYQSIEFKSDGSAMAENESRMDSVAGKASQLKAKLQELAGTTLSSDMLKGLIDAGTSLLSIVNELIQHFGSFGTLIGSIAAGKGISNFVKNFDCSAVWSGV